MGRGAAAERNLTLPPPFTALRRVAPPTPFPPTRPPARARAAAGPKAVPEFWLQALQNGRRTGATITEEDEPVLKFLTDVRLEYLEIGRASASSSSSAPTPTSPTRS